MNPAKAGSGRKAPALEGRIRRLRLLLVDVDGVLTDGGIYYLEGGGEMKRFHIHDGMGIDLLLRAGMQVGILTGRTSDLVERRARELGMQVVKQGYYDKGVALDLILAEQHLLEEEVGFVGDDVQDLPVLRRVGFRACPSDARDEVRSECDYVCRRRGGDGAVREVADLILAVLGRKGHVHAEATRPGARRPR